MPIGRDGLDVGRTIDHTGTDSHHSATTVSRTAVPVLGPGFFVRDSTYAKLKEILSPVLLVVLALCGSSYHSFA